MRLIPSCEDVARAAADGSFDEGAAWDRLRLRAHWLACYVCRRYVAQLRWLDRAAATLWGAPPPGAGELAARLKERFAGR
jgi:hypothetical protein